jgi:hypothetical protein
MGTFRHGMAVGSPDGQRFQVLPTIVIFGDPGSEALLGAVTLEEFSLGVDPVEKRLAPVVALLM